MDVSSKEKYVCYNCKTNYNVSDRKPKLLACLHCVCDHCYRANRTNKNVQHCPQCKEMTRVDGESQLDCVTINSMITQIVNDAVREEDWVLETADKMVEQTLKDAINVYSGYSDNCSKSETTSNTKHGCQILNNSPNTMYENNENKVNIGKEELDDGDDAQRYGAQRNNKTDRNWFDKLFHLNQLRDNSTESDVQLDCVSTEQSPSDTDEEQLNEVSKEQSFNTAWSSEKQKVGYPNIHVQPNVDMPVSGTDTNDCDSNGLNITANGVVCSGSLNQTGKGIVCSTKRHTDQAVCYCPECHAFLCLECQTNHADDLSTKYHRYYSTELLRKVPLSEMERNPHCIVHPEYPLIYFCQNEACKTLACVKCATNLHYNHAKTGVNEATALQQISLKELIQQIDDALLQMEDETIKMTSKTTDQDKMFQTLLEIIEKQKGELLNKVDKYYANKDVIIAHLTDLLNTKYYCDMALAYTTKSELLLVTHAIDNRAAELLRTTIPAADMLKEDLIFVSEDGTNMVQDIENLISGLTINRSRKDKSLNGKRRPEESFC